MIVMENDGVNIGFSKSWQILVDLKFQKPRNSLVGIEFSHEKKDLKFR